MWRNNETVRVSLGRGFLTPPPKWRSPASDKNQRWPTHAQSAKADLFHAIHKVPSGDSPYVRAKHVQVSAFSTLFLFLDSALAFNSVFSDKFLVLSLNLSSISCYLFMKILWAIVQMSFFCYIWPGIKCLTRINVYFEGSFTFLTFRNVLISVFY